MQEGGNGQLKGAGGGQWLGGGCRRGPMARWRGAMASWGVQEGGNGRLEGAGGGQ